VGSGCYQPERHLYLKAGTTVEAYTFSSGVSNAVYDVSFSIVQLSH
jgi:hypothetical protein